MTPKPNYRIIKHVERNQPYYALGEVVLNAKGKVIGIADEHTDFVGDTKQEVIDKVFKAMEDILRAKVVDEDRLY